MNTVEKKEQTLKRQMRTTSKILLGFLLAIFVGAGLLSLPIATVSGETDFLTALFTATISVCVTGLVVVQTFSHWTLFGKIVILGLSTMQGMVVFIKRVMKGTLAVEAVGACLYMIAFIPQFGVAHGIWYSAFNAISAFCNAGIDIIEPEHSQVCRCGSYCGVGGNNI